MTPIVPFVYFPLCCTLRTTSKNVYCITKGLWYISHVYIFYVYTWTSIMICAIWLLLSNVYHELINNCISMCHVALMCLIYLYGQSPCSTLPLKASLKIEPLAWHSTYVPRIQLQITFWSKVIVQNEQFPAINRILLTNKTFLYHSQQQQWHVYIYGICWVIIC